MGQALRDHGWVVLAALVLIPTVGAAVAWLLARWRVSRGVPPARARRHSAAEVAIVAGTVPWLVMAFTPQPAAGGVAPVPLRDLAVQLGGDPGTAVAQVVGNLLVLAAFGFAAPIRFRALGRLARVAAVACAGSVAIETGQYALDIGRVSSADDVLLNTLGAVAAAALSRPWWRKGPGARRRRATLRPGDRPPGGHRWSDPTASTAARPASRRAIGTRNGEHDT